MSKGLFVKMRSRMLPASCVGSNMCWVRKCFAVRLLKSESRALSSGLHPFPGKPSGQLVLGRLKSPASIMSGHGVGSSSNVVDSFCNGSVNSDAVDELPPFSSFG